jgi:hypothetical protein
LPVFSEAEATQRYYFPVFPACSAAFWQSLEALDQKGILASITTDYAAEGASRQLPGLRDWRSCEKEIKNH